MKARKIVYDKNDDATGLAIYDDSGLMEIDIFDAKRALEGNVFLARIEKKIRLANDKYGNNALVIIEEGRIIASNALPTTFNFNDDFPCLNPLFIKILYI